jgi:hypothetical protein
MIYIYQIVNRKNSPVKEDLIPNKMLNLIPELKVQKEAVNEKTKLTLPQNLYDFYLTEKKH